MFPTTIHPPCDVVTPAYRLKFSTVTPLPFVVSCPHAGVFTPPDFRHQLAVPLSEFLARGDRLTDWMTIKAPDFGATHVICPVSPTYINVGRSDDSLYPAHVRGGLKTRPYNPTDAYAPGGHGLVAVRTLYGDKPLYKPDCVPDEAEIAYRLKTYYTPFHTALWEQAVRPLLHKHNYCLVFDIHSCPAAGQEKDIDTGETRADVIFSNLNETSCPTSLLDFLCILTEEHGLSSAMNHPYLGGYITQRYASGGRTNGCLSPSGAHLGPTTESLQVEFNRATMGIDEQTQAIVDDVKYKRICNFANDALEVVAHYVKHRIAA